MGKPVRQAQGEVKLSSMIYAYYAEQGPGLLEDERLDVPGAEETVVRKLPVGPLLGIMPWNFPYYQVARFAAPNLMLGNTVAAQARPELPAVRAADGGDLRRRRPARRRLRQHLRHQRPGRRHHRRPAGARRLADRQRARRLGGRGDRRPQPEEGRPRARRVGRVHRARHRRHGRHREVRDPRPDVQHRPGLQRRQAVRGPRRVLRRVRRQAHRLVRRDGPRRPDATRRPRSARCPRRPRRTP